MVNNIYTMGFVRFSLAVTIFVGVAAVLIQRFSPGSVDMVLSDPTVQQFTIKANDFIQQATRKINETTYPLYQQSIKAMKPVLDYVKSHLDIGEKKKKTVKDAATSKPIKKGAATSKNIKKDAATSKPIKKDAATSKPIKKDPAKKADKVVEKTQEVKESKSSEKVFTEAELKQYDGKDGSKGVYLAIMGLVFDVSKGKEHYGPGGGYEFFSGRDASRSYVSGNFEEAGLTDDITGLSHQDHIGLKEWVDFYHKDYTYVGKVSGRYYNSDGSETAYKKQAEGWLAEARQDKHMEDSDKEQFPPCNSEWSADRGSRLWCTKKSGGMDRSWVGVPRQLFSPGKTKPRCACVKDFGAPTSGATPPKQGKQRSARGDLDNPSLKEYPGCDPKDSSCQLPDDDKN